LSSEIKDFKQNKKHDQPLNGLIMLLELFVFKLLSIN